MMLTLGLEAGSLQWGKVSDDAKWVAHLDLEGLRQTSVYKKLNELFLKEPIQSFEAELKNRTGMDIPIDGLQSITAYGQTATNTPDDEGVLLLELSPELKKLAQNWITGAQNQAVAKLPLTIHAVDAEIEGLFSIENEIMLAFDTDSNYLCLARDRDRLVKSIKRLGTQEVEGPIKSQFKQYPSPDGAMAYIAMVNVFEGAPLTIQQAKVLQMSKGASLSLGELDENIFLKLVLQTKDSGDSLQIQRILAGIQAVAMLNAQQPEWFPVIQAIDIRHQEEHVRVNWTMSLQNVTKLIHALQGSK